MSPESSVVRPSSRSPAPFARGQDLQIGVATATGCSSCCCYCWHGLTKTSGTIRWTRPASSSLQQPPTGPSTEMNMGGAESSRHQQSAAAAGAGSSSRLPPQPASSSRSPTGAASRDPLLPGEAAAGVATTSNPTRSDFMHGIRGGRASGTSVSSTTASRHPHQQNRQSTVNFPNACMPHCRESEAPAWTLLHQCGLDKWKDGHADASGFPESTMVCDGVIHKDCSFSFCMSRQGIINIHHRGGSRSSGGKTSSLGSGSSSIFSFRRRSRFAKMAEHFEYNHIPAQMSSINHFRVKSVVCYRDGLVVLHLSRNANSQFGLLDLGINKFLGVFGKQHVEFSNESLAGEISPDKSRCLIRCPKVGGLPAEPGVPLVSVFCLFDLKTRDPIREIDAVCAESHFCFDPRFTWRRLAIANFEPRRLNAVSVVDASTWTAIVTNRHAADTRRTLYPYLNDLCYTRDGRMLIATLLDPVCSCRERKTRGYRAVPSSIYVFDADSAATLHCIEYRRCTCPLHCCPINYKPAFGVCGGRLAVVMDSVNGGGGGVAGSETSISSSSGGSGSQHVVQVYKLPTSGLSLQALCRIAILQQCRLPVQSSLVALPLPTKVINYLMFRPEFD